MLVYMMNIMVNPKDNILKNNLQRNDVESGLAHSVNQNDSGSSPSKKSESY